MADEVRVRCMVDVLIHILSQRCSHGEKPHRLPIEAIMGGRVIKDGHESRGQPIHNLRATLLPVGAEKK